MPSRLLPPGWARVQECPHCQYQTQVIETRGSRRRRRCPNCDSRYNTIELPADGIDKLFEREKFLTDAIETLKTLLAKLEEG